MSQDKTTAKAKREAQQRGIRYGCHLELEEGMEPDGCVKDCGDEGGCIYARRHRSREACKYWMPVEVGNVQP